MKTHLSKKSIYLSVLSFLALGIFVLLAAGSIFGPDIETTYLGDGVYEEKTLYRDGDSEIITGKRDQYGRWRGSVIIEYKSKFSKFQEEVSMVDGKRHGVSTHTDGDGKSSTHHYDMGICIDLMIALQKSWETPTAFQLLSTKYPWFLFALNAFDFNDEYVEAYMDTLETVLNGYVFDIIDFDENYTDAIDVLTETPYDSILNAGGFISYLYGLRQLRNDQLRMAVLDGCWLGEPDTWNILQNTYPGYSVFIDEIEVSDPDFEEFCYDLDSCIASYGVLDTEDPYFIDSVNLYMFRGLTSIEEEEESSKAAVWKKSARYGEFRSIIDQSILNSTPEDVANAVLMQILFNYSYADIVHRTVMEAYFISKGVVRIPTATTELSGHNSATSVSLKGNVIEDGGAEVTARGIAWAAFYNPTINDNSESSSTGTGSFEVNLNDLNEGSDYYARTYASNSTGTAYGNCIRFTAANTMGMNEEAITEQDLIIFPNPASAITTFSFRLESLEELDLVIIDVNGRVVLQHYAGTLREGENHVELDLSGLPGGVYHCLLKKSDAILESRKFIIAR
jgi:Secretion system C-terminal sorting domain